MKKNLIFYIVALAALLATSCTRELFPGDGTDRGLADGQTGLVVSVRSSNPQTKMIAPPDTYNENRLEQFYYFIFKNDPSSAGHTGDAPVLIGKWEAPEGEEGEEVVVTDIGTKRITLDELTELASADGNTYSGWVYVIANYKAEETLALWDAMIDAPTETGLAAWTWTALQALPLPPTFEVYNNISDTSLWPDERMDEKADEGHRFMAQDSFVMASKPTYFSVAKGVAKDIDADLYRLAAKLNLNIKLAKWYVQTNNGEYKYTWYSIPERVQVYLNYAANSGTMDGEAIKYKNNEDKFFTYRRFAFLSKWTKQGDEYIFPNGNYTEKLPQKWILDAEKASQTQPVDGKYYTAYPDLEDVIVVIDGDIKYREITRSAYKVEGTPFYSYPYDYSEDSGHAPFFKVIVEWDAFFEEDKVVDEVVYKRATDEAPGENGTLKIGHEPFYYKITIPKQTILTANYWYNIDLHVSVLGSEVDETAIDLTGLQGYYVVDWSNPLQAVNPDLNAGRYLSVTSSEYEKISGEDVPVFHMYGNAPLEIPMTSSHPVEIVNASATYTKFNPAGEGELTLSETDATGDNFKVIAKNLNAVEIEHVVETNIANIAARDISKITYTFTIQQKDNPSFSKVVKVYQYPPIYISKKDGGNVFLDGFFQYLDGVPTGYSNPRAVGSGYRSATYGGTPFQYPSTYPNGTTTANPVTSTTAQTTPYGNLAMDDLTQETETTLITVSLFDSNSETFTDQLNGNGANITYHYKIMDPRVDNTWTQDLIPYLTGQSAATGTVTLYHADWENQESIKVASNLIPVGPNEYNAPIAPAFLITSRWGRPGGGTFPRTLEQAEQRCATYQEAGYPAGRWRLPTDAEAYFVYSLQNRWNGTGQNNNDGKHGLISQMFTTSGFGYWTSSGRRFGGDGGGHFFSSATTNNGISIRCVYDYWYWEEQDRNVYKFTPKP